LAGNDTPRKSDTGSQVKGGRFIQALPVGVVAALACWESWHDSGSVAAAAAHGFLPYAVVTALLLAVVTWSGATGRPTRASLVAVGLLGALAVWAAVSLLWSPVPSLARDEALLTAYYALALALPLVGLRTAEARLAAAGLVTAVLAVFTVAVALKVGLSADAIRLFPGGRLYFPITYANAQSAQFALGFWPALLFASRRTGSVAARALGLGAAVLFLSAATLAQSKGTTLGLAVSVVVVLTLSQARLRLLVPLLLCLAIEAVAFRPLTEPYRNETLQTVHTAGLAVLIAALAAVIVGIVYARLDDRVRLTESRRRLAGRVVAVLTLAAVVASAAAFVAVERHPVRFVQSHWASFKHFDPSAGGATHLTALGSNRYDFWRVSLIEFQRHPVEGCGARCFGPEYLVLGKSGETPARAHSLPLEVLGEQGLVGFVLLMGAFAALLGMLARGARRLALTSTAALGAFVCWLVQASVDWTWTFPAVTVPAFLLAGLGAAAVAQRSLARPVPAAAAAACAALALIAFLPPWYAARLTKEALQGSSPNAAASLRWAQRLDPVSTAPLIARAQLASSVADQLRYLRAAAKREPRVLQTQYYLGSVLLNAGQKAQARRLFEHADSLDPGNRAVARALRLSR
jgi:hypothetical protein